MTLDLGQGRELNQIRERAMSTGAIRCHVLDVREEFARDYVLPALQADALYEERYPLATALSRPLIAKKLVDIAHMENATAIAHGCTGKGNDQVRIDVSARAIDPAITVIAPARDCTDSKSTSPASLPVSRRFMPTSMTQAPSFTMSPVIMRGRPAATQSTSARRVCAARSRVRV